ncbi:GNAT family N-acetyltransferase [Flavobacterium paronense]|uniref:GNAT family N-acetyltransferase n=1 Tax=Flavobacterium paronense TaxID=1392775 RepID=A0ABV5GBV1_9FLAO|nr:GNAT family N-acetyltransferase [Flavobacterium paronense]MDN3677767.1 GNAT family N-acetyltransferase [Flavobacterium paronense]
MIAIQNNTDENFNSIRAIAKEVWPIAYGAILSQEQLDYMMKMMYSIPSLQLQANAKKHRFILAKEGETVLGFASYEFNYIKKPKTKVHKIYILPNQQGKGIGKELITFIIKQAKERHQKGLILNVNKKNIAVRFYERLGFEISFEEILDIGNGYVMDDYVMEKSI